MSDRVRRWVALLALPCVCAFASPSAAEPASLGPDLRGAPGYFRVPVVAAAPRGMTLAGGLAYGFTEARVEAPGAHHRLQGRVAASVAPLSWLGLAAMARVRHDRHGEDELGADHGTVVEGQLHGRAGTRLGSDLHLGVAFGASFIRGESLARSLSSPSVDGQLLAAYLPKDAPLSLGIALGYRYDGRSGVIEDPARYRAGDRLALGISAFDAVPLGVGTSYRFGKTELVAELSGDLLVGSGAPPLLQSPLRATLGARHRWTDELALRLMTDTSLSSPPATGADDPLSPVEPRFQVLMGLAYHVVSWEPEPTPAVRRPTTLRRPEPKPAPKPPAPDVTLEVDVTTREGYPLSDATVRVEFDGKSVAVPHHNLQSFRLEAPMPLQGTLVVEAERLQTQRRQVTLRPERPNVFVVQLEPAAPSGQIRGRVRSPSGRGLRASIRIEPLGRRLKTAEDGSFEVDVPPGSYDVLIEAAGHGKQRRTVKVARDGVVVLNADLLRGKR